MKKFIIGLLILSMIINVYLIYSGNSTWPVVIQFFLLVLVIVFINVKQKNS